MCLCLSRWTIAYTEASVYMFTNSSETVTLMLLYTILRNIDKINLYNIFSKIHPNHFISINHTLVTKTFVVIRNANVKGYTKREKKRNITHITVFWK